MKATISHHIPLEIRTNHRARRVLAKWLAVAIAAQAGFAATAGEPVNGAVKAAKAAANNLQQVAESQKILAKLKNAGNVDAALFATALNNEGLAVTRTFKTVKGLQVLSPKPGVQKVLDKAALQNTVKNLQASGLFEYVELDQKVSINQLPTDSAFTDGTLWGLRNTGQNGGVSGIDVNAVNAWDVTTGDPSVVVAVIDTGIRYTHQDLAANMWTNPGEIPNNGIDDDGNGYIDDVYGINAITGSGNPMDDNSHGTHCAGTIAATAFGGGGHVGVAYNVKLMALKFLDASGSGDTSDAVACVDYATVHGAHLSNNSWSGGGFSQALEDVIQAANDAGSLFVAAASNNSTDNDVVARYPANYDVENVISVAAIDRTGALASFSNYGATTVDLGAPGVAIYSCTADTNTSYASYQGTSMAAPHVAGVAALVVSRFPGISITDLRARLMDVTPLASLNGKTVTGGMVNAFAALNAAPDGTLELSVERIGTGNVIAGAPNTMTIRVNDFTPVTGATVTGYFGNNSPRSFLDNGVRPDLVANDGIYTARLNCPLVTGTVSFTANASAPDKTPATKAFTLPVRPTNDDFARRILLPFGTTATTGTNIGATLEVGEPTNPSAAGGRSVWWAWTAATTGEATITTFSSNYDTTLAVYSGNSFANLSLLGSNDDAGSGLQSSVTFSATAGITYIVQVDGWNGSQGSVQLNYPPPAGLPEIVVEQPPGTGITDGSATVAYGDVIVGKPVTRTFRIRNTGDSNLTGLTITKSGANPQDFTVVTAPTAPIAPGGSTLFTVEFAPSSLGVKSASIQIASNDADENPFDINLTGKGLAPEIAVEQPPGSGLTDGSSTVAFGTVTLGTTVTRTFRIRNWGNYNLNGLKITRAGANPTDFIVTTAPTAPVSPGGGSTLFVVQFAPTKLGTKSAIIRIASNDADENPFDINLTGTALAADIAVEQPPGTGLMDGESTVSYGSAAVGTPVLRYFRIRNWGNTDLTGLTITKGGANPGDFTIPTKPTAPLAPGASSIFTVQFTPSTTGARSAVIRIASNDPDENPFVVALTGTGVTVPLAAAMSSEVVEIEPPSNTLKVGGTRNFRSVAVGDTSKTALFTIKSPANEPLDEVDVEIVGKNASHFKLINTTAKHPGDRMTFRVAFKPKTIGEKNAILRITSKDPNQKTVRMKLTGNADAVGGLKPIAD